MAAAAGAPIPTTTLNPGLSLGQFVATKFAIFNGDTFHWSNHTGLSLIGIIRIIGERIHCIPTQRTDGRIVTVLQNQPPKTPTKMCQAFGQTGGGERPAQTFVRSARTGLEHSVKDLEKLYDKYRIQTAGGRPMHVPTIPDLDARLTLAQQQRDAAQQQRDAAEQQRDAIQAQCDALQAKFDEMQQVRDLEFRLLQQQLQDALVAASDKDRQLEEVTHTLGSLLGKLSLKSDAMNDAPVQRDAVGSEIKVEL